MKKVKKLLGISLLATLLFALSCNKGFLTQNAQGELSDEQVQNQKGVEWLLTGAYGIMNGAIEGTWGNYGSAPSQWLYGDVAADNAHKGSEVGDQVTMLDIERHNAIPVNEHLSAQWATYYEGVIRCNTVLRQLAVVQSSDDPFPDERAKEIEGEAKMLRGHYYFYLWRVFKNIPYIDESLTTVDAAQTPNNTDVLPKIEEDFRVAVNNLAINSPMGDVGRANQISAKAYLGKVLLYEKKYSEALPLFKDVIAARPDLKTLPFLDNFDINKENGPESIWAAQQYINPDGGGDNANVGDMLSGPSGQNPAGCCGFFNPSIDLASAYSVGSDGLPMLDDSYRNTPVLSDFGLTGAAKTDYKPDQTLRVDPRLDYTLGRRGVMYHDWGQNPGDAWVRDPAVDGPYIPYKQMIDQADFPGNVANDGAYVTGLNVNIIRLADVYLMAAECAASSEVNDLAYAMDRVNDVRTRAQQIPPQTLTPGGAAAADYRISLYTSFPDNAFALKAIQFERRLELALEGHRFFDLVRWGIAKQTLDSYSTFEGSYISIYSNVTFREGVNEIFPIPQEQIDRSGGALTQNSF